VFPFGGAFFVAWRRILFWSIAKANATLERVNAVALFFNPGV